MENVTHNDCVMSKTSKTIMQIATLALGVILLSGCARTNTAAIHADIASVPGFWQGLWNGMTAPVMFFWGLLVDHGVTFYEVRNNGGWYDFGFLLGVGAFAKGATSSRKKGGE